MKKLMAFVLSFGLVLLGMAPVMASGIPNSALPSTQLTDDDLNIVLGAWNALGGNSVLDEGIGGSGGGGGANIGQLFLYGFIVGAGGELGRQTMIAVEKGINNARKNYGTWVKRQREGTRLLEKREAERRARDREQERRAIERARRR